MSRTAVLIRCGTDEARKIRYEAEHERRTVSGYVLNILERSLQVEDSLFHKIPRLETLNRVLSRRPKFAMGPRTAILVRCSTQEAARIRFAAKRRQLSISNFVMHALRRVWRVRETGVYDPNFTS